jgi:hypothetical protein
MEALTNVVRHSGATQANLALRVGDDDLTIDISDNGNPVGEWTPGIGITSMKERASELGGTVTYRSAPTGSTVTAKLPLGSSGAATPQRLTSADPGGPDNAAQNSRHTSEQRALADLKQSGMGTTTRTLGIPHHAR